MNEQVMSSSAGTKDWLETTQGWVIYAYVGGDLPTQFPVLAGAQPDKPYDLQGARQITRRRTELPFGENIRDTIRSLRSK